MLNFGLSRGYGEPVKTNVYIDGFNFYYGAVKGTAYKWLDFAALCRTLFPRNDLHRIRYFTAMVDSRSPDPQQQVRQQTYIRPRYRPSPTCRCTSEPSKHGRSGWPW